MNDFILFIDESGDPSLKSVNKAFPIFVLLGILIKKDEYKRLETTLKNLKYKFFGSDGAILHSREIRKCEGVFATLFDLKIKERFFRELNEIMGDGDYKIIASAIHKEKHIARYGRLADDPYEIGLIFLLERALFELDEANNSANVVIESRGDKEDKLLAASFNQLITRGSYKVSPDRFVARYGTKAQFRRKSENDCGLQMADLCAYPTARHILHPNEPQPAFDIISNKFRKSSRGQIEGYGVKIFP